MTIAEAVRRDLLTETEAAERAARVRDVAYKVALDLEAGADRYGGDVSLSFRLEGDADSIGRDLFLDFRGARIERLEVNGERQEPDWTGYRLTLPGRGLRRFNDVRLVYQNEYDRTGDGFHHFVDPEDGQEYLYTNFEPYDAHRLFPSFDQPDIKGSFELSVIAPDAWEVVGNGRELGRAPAGDGRVVHTFERTPRFSTYLMAVIAGPYHVVRREHHGLPLGLYCRRSLAGKLEADEIFDLTIQGLDFYASLFDQPYAFTKFDQLFVPEFNAGAMENVGAVTHSEHFIFRDPPTENQRLERAEVILHELAHMWFGNLVTMRWWNDLWLNESFASYVAFVAMSEATRFRDSWKSFNSSMKRWAYRQDQLVTTHPIAGETPDTDATFLNFDGITYGKGASVLKQLVATIGRDGFRDGMRTYFRRHAWGNATLRDFFAALEEGSGRPLAAWARAYLETASLNTIAARTSVRDGLISELVLEQSAPPGHPTLRPHALRVALVAETVDGGVEVTSIPAVIQGATTRVPEATGRPAPALVFPNHADHAYAKVALDPASVTFVRQRLERIDDPLLRQLLWMSLWEMVRDRQLRSTEFLDIVRAKIGLEPDLELVETVLGRTQVVLSHYVPESRRHEEAQRTFETALRQLRAARDSDGRIIWARGAIGAAATAGDVGTLLELMDGTHALAGGQLDQEMRWTAIAKAVAHGVEGADERLEAERRRDSSDRGERMAIRAEVSRPDPAGKASAWERVVGEGYGSFHLTAAAMQGFWWPDQHGILAPYEDRFFDEVQRVFERHDKVLAEAFAEKLYPRDRANPAVLERTRALISELGDRNPMLVRLLREAADDLERAIAVRAFAAEPDPSSAPEPRTGT